MTDHLTTADLARLGAMIQTTDGNGWHALATIHGLPAVREAIAKLSAEHHRPMPLSGVRAYLGTAKTTTTLTTEDDTMTDDEKPTATTDELMTRLEAHLKAGPRGAVKSLFQSPGLVGLSPSNMSTWRKSGIPEIRCGAVQDFIAKGWPDDTAPAPAKPRRAPRAVAERPQPINACIERGAGSIASALAGIAQTVYVVRDGRLVECKGILL